MIHLRKIRNIYLCLGLHPLHALEFINEPSFQQWAFCLLSLEDIRNLSMTQLTLDIDALCCAKYLLLTAKDILLNYFQFLGFMTSLIAVKV